MFLLSVHIDFTIGCGNGCALLTFDDLSSLANVSNGYDNINWNYTFECGKWTVTENFTSIAAAYKDNLQLNVVGYRSNSTTTNRTSTFEVFSIFNITFIGYSCLDILANLILWLN
ncbi:unnamed protein product [Adineta ricciae]|uniref:Uncharacterized protein n=1 Tax=Adineta ricciae TaxID=249248 RepID=A0A816AZW8_ADIRI|nr:unnamed protein product [Adineta ricciae]